MDQRLTYETLTELQALIAELYRLQAHADLLLDREGLTRRSGTIATVETQTSAADTWFQLHDATDRIYLGEVIAVNGIFRSDYSEC